MKYFAVLALALAFVACKQAPKEVKQYTIKQFMDNESVRGGSFSADNSTLLISSNRSGIYNIYTIPATGGEMTAITNSDSTSKYASSFFPNDDRILFSADGDGDEISHLFVRELDGTVKDITNVKGAKASFYGWSHAGSHLYYGSNKRDKRFFDVYKMELENYTSQMIYKNESGMNFTAISNDENYFALSKTVNTNDSDLFLYNAKTNKTTKINSTLSSNSAEDFSVDSKMFYYTTDDGSEFSYLMSYNLENGDKKKVAEKKWDIMGAGFTHKGTYLVIYINEDGKNAIEVRNAKTMEPISLPGFAGKSITSVSFSRDESWMRMYVGGSNAPSDLYSYNLSAKKQHKLTSVLNKEIAAADLVSAQVIRYKSFDGVEIPAIYYLPKQASATNKVPALVWVHGGPGGQSRQGYRALIQYMVNQGYAVLAVNNRGSSGYGKTFFTMDDKNHGEGDLQDCVEGKNWLAKQEFIDPEKIGIIGGSYGGYMVMAALTYTPEEFKVGVNIFGVTNWLRTLKSIPPYWESFRKALYLELGDPFTADSVRLKRISPLFHTEHVNKPLMVLQGANDPRVLQVESDEIVANVKKNNVPVEYVLFEDEGHGFAKKENQIEAYGRIVSFLNQYLKGENSID